MFVKGQSGNPGGRPKALKEVMAAAQKEGIASVQALVAIRDDEKAPHAARAAAANALLDRGFGKPVQPSEVSGPDGSPLLDGIKIVLTRPNDRG